MRQKHIVPLHFLFSFISTGYLSSSLDNGSRKEIEMPKNAKHKDEYISVKFKGLHIGQDPLGCNLEHWGASFKIGNVFPKDTVQVPNLA